MPIISQTTRDACFQAAIEGNKQWFKQNLSKDDRLHLLRNRERKTPLYLALENKHYDCAKFLINYGVVSSKVRIEKDKNFPCPFLKAAKLNLTDHVKLMLDKDILKMIQTRDMAAIIALKENRKDLFEVICKSYKSPEALKEFFKRVFFEIVKNRGDAKSTESLLRFISEGMYIPDKILKKIINDNFKDISLENRVRPLHYAATSGQLDMVHVLLRAGSDPDIVDDKGETAAKLAEKADHQYVALYIESFSKLVRKYSSERIPSICANNALQLFAKAVKEGKHINLIRSMIGIMDSINYSNINGVTALHIAAYYGDEEIVKDILAKGGEVDKVDKKGRAPLHYACTLGKLEIVKCLLEENADPLRIDNKQKSAKDYAVENNHAEILQTINDKVKNLNLLPKYSRKRKREDSTTESNKRVKLSHSDDNTKIHSFKNLVSQENENINTQQIIR